MFDERHSSVWTRAMFGAAVLLLACLSGVQAAQDLTLGHVGIGDDPAQTAARAFVAQLERRLPGRFNIIDKGGSSLGSEGDIWEAVSLGGIDIAIVSTVGVTPFVPQIGILDVPFLFRDSLHAAKVLNGPIGRDLGANFLEKGLVCLGFIEIGFRQVTNSKRPIREPSDIAGLRIRLPPSQIYELTFKALGAEVIAMPFTEVYGALDDERIDGQENPILRIAGAHFDRVQNFIALTNHAFTPAVILINEGVWKSLTRADRAEFLAATSATVKAFPKALAEAEGAAIVAFKENGISVSERVDRDAFISALAPLRPEWEKRFGANMLKRIENTF
jgi:tripartite ATP-independent transporter DctP family solute receptor